MAKRNPTPPAPVLEPLTKDDELPTVEAIGVCRAKNGFVAFVVTVQGQEVLDTELLGPVESRANALDRARLGFIRLFQLPSPSALKA